MTISDEISIIANQLANQGKVPSVALIKAKLSQPTPLPNIIAVLKAWQHEPNFIKIATEDKITDEQDSADLADEKLSFLITQAILPIQQELQEIKTLLKKLTSTH